MTAQEFFKNDRFATNAGVELIEIKEGYSKARLVITAEHLNAGGRTQGGAIFTLADLALAAAANWPSLFRPISPSCAAADRAMYCMPKHANATSAAPPDITRSTSPTRREN
mgnify:CR=1 FL=1